MEAKGLEAAAKTAFVLVRSRVCVCVCVCVCVYVLCIYEVEHNRVTRPCHPIQSKPRIFIPSNGEGSTCVYVVKNNRETRSFRAFQSNQLVCAPLTPVKDVCCVCMCVCIVFHLFSFLWSASAYTERFSCACLRLELRVLMHG